MMASVALLITAGCHTTLPTEAPEETEAATSAAFLACLTAAGVEARLGDQGHVLVRQAGAPSMGADGTIEQSAGAGSGDALLIEGDGEGNQWVAAASSEYFADDPELQEAYAGCESSHPDFSQPAYDPANDPEVQEYLAEQAEAGLAFAQCARDEGFAWVADPDPATGGAVSLPADLTEAEFRALLEACWDPAMAGLAWSLPSSELSFDWQAVLEEYVSGDAAVSSDAAGSDA